MLNRSFTVVVHGQKPQKGCIKCTLTSKEVKNKWNAYKRNFPIIVDDRSSGSIRLFAINDYQISGDFPTDDGIFMHPSWLRKECSLDLVLNIITLYLLITL